MRTTLLIFALIVNYQLSIFNSFNECNLQTVIEIYIDYKLAKNSYTADALDTLRTLAAECPFIQGIAVYQARVLLANIDTIQYINACEVAQQVPAARLSKEQYSKTEFILYPNPAKEEVKITYSLEKGQQGTVEIYNLVGEKMQSILLNNESNDKTISIVSYNSGIYIYKYIIDGELKAADKLLIIK